ncbi:MAG: helix-turn-helix domain-containing protein [Acidobacteria bacterium]|nr:helix-turn-helix domain-containing protein [Acidobacteriota bacterium]
MSEGSCRPLVGDSGRQLQDCDLPAAATNALPREVVKCRQCLLVQFRPMADLCRRCASKLPPPPLFDFGLPGDRIVIDARAAGSSAFSRKEAPILWESDWYPPPHIRRQQAVGPRHKKLREQRGLTQQEVAARAGVPRSYVSRIENSHLLPGPVIVQRLAEALGVEIAELFPEEGNGNRSPHSEEDQFGVSVIHYFAQLQPQQMLAVLSRLRNMVGAGLQRNEMVCRS